MPVWEYPVDLETVTRRGEFMLDVVYAAIDGMDEEEARQFIDGLILEFEHIRDNVVTGTVAEADEEGEA